MSGTVHDGMALESLHFYRVLQGHCRKQGRRGCPALPEDAYSTREHTVVLPDVLWVGWGEAASTQMLGRGTAGWPS